jgi:hypothetical protein
MTFIPAANQPFAGSAAGPITGDQMIIDERTYTCHPGKVKAFLEVYERLGKPIQWPIVGEPIGFFTIDTGTLCQVVHMWKYENMADREQRRLKLSSAPGWSAYLDASMPLLSAMENRILVPISFSPLK